MVQPIDYTVDVQQPFQAALQGYQAGSAIRNDQLAQQQQQIALAQQQRQQQALQQFSAIQNPTAEDHARLMLAVPQYREVAEQAWKMRSAEQQQNLLSDMLQWGSAIKSGYPKIAADMMDARADALEATNGGMPSQDSQAMRVHAQIVRAHPEFALGKIRAMIAANPNAEKATQSLAALDANDREQALSPGKVREQNAKATTAEVEAGNAPTKVYWENVNAGENAKTAESQRKIAELGIQIQQANSETQRQELQLKRDQLQFELGQKQQDQTNSAQDSMDSLTAALDTTKRLMNHPGLTAGSGRGGDFNAWFAGTDAADFRNEVEALKSQEFLTAFKALKSNGGSGLGALSDAEGAKLESAIARLDPSKQSPQAVMNALGIINKGLEKAQSTLVARGKLPSNGGAVIDVPGYGKVSEGQINALMRSQPGATRENVIQFLQSTRKNTGGATGTY